MALWPGPKDSTFWFDFEGLTDGNLWPDKGPYGLHATPGAAFAAPNYGLARSAHGKGYITTTGGVGGYGDLLAGARDRFYAHAPVGAHTWVYLHSTQAVTGIAPRVFSCESGNFGIAATTVTTTNPGNLWAVNNSGAAVRYSQGPAGCFPLTPTQAVIFTMETNPRLWLNRFGYTTTWALGAFGNPAYDAATVPRIGQQPAGGGATACRLYFLALLPFALTDQEARAMSAWLMDQV